MRGTGLVENGRGKDGQKEGYEPDLLNHSGKAICSFIFAVHES
jgi:hypothetical protein